MNIQWAWCILICCSARISGETRADYWKQAKADLKASLNIEMNTFTAKNVILFIGDGMSMTTITAARIYKGQMDGMKENDVKAKLSFDQFPYVGLAKTYNNDRQVTSSASAATALMCGVKVNYGTVGVDSSVKRKDCATQQSGTADIDSILKQSKGEGKSVGLVTTSRITHATPAAAYAHSVDRNWESTKNIANDGKANGCKDIASQLIDNGDIDVILGGGRRAFLLANQTDPQSNKTDSNQRTDGRDLIQDWKDMKKTMGKSYKYVWNKSDFDTVDAEKTDYLLGLFNPSHMKYDIDRGLSEPSIADMTEKAVKILKKNPKGFFLMVEGARIDHAHHENYARRALHDVLAMDNAVKVAMAQTSERDTLIIVTADHSQAFIINGYPSRGNDILGVVDIVPEDEAPYDGLPYTTLSYTNGPANYTRKNISNDDTVNVEYQQAVGVGMPWDTHSGEEVPVYARGPLSHLFHGVHENNYVYHVMAYASCVGDNKQHCTNPVSPPCTMSTAAATSSAAVFFSSCLYTVLSIL